MQYLANFIRNFQASVLSEGKTPLTIYSTNFVIQVLSSLAIVITSESTWMLDFAKNSTGMGLLSVRSMTEVTLANASTWIFSSLGSFFS